MEYISAREAAARWGVHIRVVQNLCRAGRVSGARKYGNVWMLPASAAKPGDPRRKPAISAERPEYDGSGLLTMASVSMPMGSAVPPEALGTKHQKAQLEAEFAFLRGDLTTAARAFESTARTDPLILCAATLTMAATSRVDEPERFRQTEDFLQALLRSGSERERLLAEIALATALLGQFATDMAPEWILNALFSHAPVEARPMSVYLYTKSLQGRHRPDELLSVCKTARALWARDDRFTLLDVYLGLLLADACRTKGDLPGCFRALEQAAALAMPYGFVTPFAEYRPLMAAEMDAVLRTHAPSALGSTRELSERIWQNWQVFHTRFIRNHLPRLLSPKELRLAQRVAKGTPYREAAHELSMTQGELKQALADIYRKLYISDRSDLVRFFL